MTEACPIDLLLVVLKWPFVLHSCLNGYNTEEATGVWLTLSALRGKRFFCCCSMGTALKTARDTGDSVDWLNVDRIAPRTPPPLHTPHPPKVSIEYWTHRSVSCFLNLRSPCLEGKWNLVERKASLTLCSQRTPEWPHFTLLGSQVLEWQIDCCMGGYQKRIYFISCLSCKVKSFFKTLSKCHHPRD